MRHINVAELSGFSFSLLFKGEHVVMCSSLSLAEPMPYTGICREAALADRVMTSVA